MHLSSMLDTIEPQLARILFERAKKYSNVIDLTLGDPDFHTPDNVKEAGIAEVEFTLESGEFFCMGDNVNNSEDSRSGNIGPVSRDMIEGKAWFALGKGVSYSGFIK